MMDYKYTDRGKEHGGEGAMGAGCAQGCGSQLPHPHEAPGWVRQGLCGQCGGAGGSATSARLRRTGA